MTLDSLATPQLLTDQDLYLFNEGSNYRLYEKMGAHLVTHNGEAGAVFSGGLRMPARYRLWEAQ